MAKAGELRFVVTTDASGAITDMKKITGGVDELDKNTKKATGSWGKLGRRIAAAISIYAGARLFQSIGKAAIDAAETTSKFGVVFEKELSKANAITQELTSSYGFSVTGAEAALSSVGDLAQGLGIASGESLRMAEATAKFATDLVSFTNVAGGTERAIDALTKAQLGEREMLKAYGIAIMEADVQQRLLLKGQKDLEGAALKAAKANAVLELAMEQSKNAAGNFALTMRDPANQLRILDSAAEDFRVGLGKAITQQDGFKDSIEATTSVLKDKALQEGLAQIISSLTKIASIAIQAAAGLVDFFTEASKGKLVKQTADQTEQLVTHYKRQRDAIKEAGISLKTYVEARREQPEFTRLEELTEAIEKQKAEIEDLTKVAEDSPMGHVLAKQIEDRQESLNKLLLEQVELRVNATRNIIKNAEAYGISEKQTEAYTKALKGDLEETIKAVKAKEELEKQSKKTTKAIETQKQKTERLKKLTETFTGLIEKQTEGIRVQAERIELDLIPGLDTQNMLLETSKKILLEKVDATKRESEETKKLAEEYKSLMNAISRATDMIAGFIQQSGELLGLTPEMSAGLSGVISGFGDLVSGNILGGVQTLIGSIGDLSKALHGPTFTDFLPQATEDMRSIGINSEDAALKYAIFIAAVESGNAEMEDAAEFGAMLNETLKDTSAAAQAAGINYGKLLISLEKANEAQEQYEETLEEFAKTQPEFWENMFSSLISPLTEFLKTAATSQGEFNDQVNVTLDTFAAAINSGMGYAEALRAMEEPFGLLTDSMEEFGFTSTGVFSDLLNLQQKVADNEQLISSIDAFNSLLSASGDLIGGNQEKFDSYVNLAVANYDKLLEKEFTQQEALLLTAPALQQLQELQEKYGFTVDENTQKLIDEADSLGLFKTDPLDKIVEVLELIAVQLGATLPEAAESGAQRTAAAFDKLTDKAINDFERMSTAASGVIIPVSNGGAAQTQPPLIPIGTPGFANGGSGVVPPGFNNDDFFVGLSSGEKLNVTPARGNSTGGGAGVTTVSIVNNVPQTFNQQVSPKQVMDAVIEAGKEAYRKDEFNRVFR